MCIYRGQCPSYFTVGWSQLSGTVFPIVLFVCFFTHNYIDVLYLCDFVVVLLWAVVVCKLHFFFFSFQAFQVLKCVS